MPVLCVPASVFSLLGEMTVGERIGVGEAQLDTELRVRAGRYRVLRSAPATGGAAMQSQLLCVHIERQLADVDIAGMREATRFPIEGARFTLADAALDEVLHDMTGYYKYLEGVNGVLPSGNGVTLTLTLERGGEAVVWLEQEDRPSVVLVDIGRAAEPDQAKARLVGVAPASSEQ